MAASAKITRRTCLERDDRDPLRGFRRRFVLPAGVIYLDGNSLGALPKETPARLSRVVEAQWGRDLIGSWNTHGWIDLPERLGDKIGGLIGAAAGQTLVCDSTSVNLFKLLAAALALRPTRRTILTQRDNFPTDLYVAGGLKSLLGEERCTIRSVEESEIAAAIDDTVAVLLLTHVNFRSGRVHDMASITRAAHDRGALVLWDLSHSAGAMPLRVDRAEVDLVVGCGYKYLNGGPGAPAFLYVAQRHQDRFRQPLWGWLGHAEPFAFDADYRPAPGIRQAQCGTPAVLGLAALEAGVDLWLEADLEAVRAKSVALTELFIAMLGQQCGDHGFRLVSPRDSAVRGSQVSIAHPDGHAIMQALIADGVIGDFRSPDLLRFGFAPLYNRYVDVWQAMRRLAAIMREKRYMQPEFQHRQTVT